MSKHIKFKKGFIGNCIFVFNIKYSIKVTNCVFFLRKRTIFNVQDFTLASVTNFKFNRINPFILQKFNALLMSPSTCFFYYILLSAPF